MAAGLPDQTPDMGGVLFSCQTTGETQDSASKARVTVSGAKVRFTGARGAHAVGSGSG
jgi:hypothetical protein